MTDTGLIGAFHAILFAILHSSLQSYIDIDITTFLSAHVAPVGVTCAALVPCAINVVNFRLAFPGRVQLRHRQNEPLDKRPSSP